MEAWEDGRGAGNEKSVLEAKQTACAWPLFHLGFTLKISCKELAVWVELLLMWLSSVFFVESRNLSK